MPYLEREGDVFILYLGNRDEVDNENRFHPDWITAVHAALDEVEAHEGPAALVTTATGKFYTNGLDTEWLFANMDSFGEYLDRVHTVYARLLAFPMTTVAAVQGHAFGAGAMLATAHDLRVMRGDRGFYNLPEAQLNMPFTVGMNALMTTQLPRATAVEAMTTSRRYGGADALAAGIVNQVADESELLGAAVARAAATAALHGPNLAGIKRGIHAALLEALSVKTPKLV
ncbi:enoyl-CoA hydratase/isomerase family protein [Rhodococcus sp. D2-41]|uniref:Enoyl-CoA hydratase/isomerase family protein n=1 Tax=Speluncibacter jeojiensis TaxID=2710754 RepID=A0A9X4RFN7_9ACTN|nr:enoyl-CoA hydratase/isomerase family protein [Rhodococcus sp. D2-41]MDG3008857.1 enoyl-CoA hydratase/isomerase family protein [Rhodococcus sp. D2-41]MDG3016477.1 enoyl-CoA hydratase/isomerase family protein [Corynebacteriales bacterium D3-21]